MVSLWCSLTQRNVFDQPSVLFRVQFGGKSLPQRVVSPLSRWHSGNVCPSFCDTSRHLINQEAGFLFQHFIWTITNNQKSWKKSTVNIHVLCLVAQLCPTLCDPMCCSLPGSSVHGDSPGKNTRVGYHALLQGIFRGQGLNPGLPHCRWSLPAEPPGKPM